MTTHDILRKAIDASASDIHLAVGRPPTIRVFGSLKTLNDIPLKSEDIMSFVKDITPDSHLQLLEVQGGSDYSYVLDGTHSFRVSVFKQQGSPSCVLRLIPPYIMDIGSIGLGDKVDELLKKQRGLILITGPTGSGKSTTLAAMIDVINSTRECNIITVEDPIEYRHHHKKSIVVQREVGEDVPSFDEAIIRALRQDPDVILVGEMRNYETIEAAVRAAETGHLVMSTLHTTGAVRTVDRIVDVFPPTHRDEIRVQLAGVLLSVISQQLIPRVDGNGRIAAFEVMFNTPSISTYIRDNKSYRIMSDLQTGAKFGMTTMDGSLLKLYMAEIISYQDMIDHCYDRDLLHKLLEDYAGAGQKTTNR